MPSSHSGLAFTLGLLVPLASAACGGGAAGPPPAPPPAAVTVVSLEQKPVTISTEFVGVLRSRQSSEIRPQVEGIITQIFVKSGDRVAPGRALLQIDPLRQQASLESNEASRIAQEAAVGYARQQYNRARQLLDAGATSQQEFEQAETNLKTAQASLEALRAREQEARVELQYYRVTSPTEGIVGDIPVRVGDRVTSATVLTTVDRRAGLEVYVQVPVERAPDIRLGLPVRIRDRAGEILAESAVNFVSPQVDDRTQSVLLKAPIDGQAFRTEQFVRAEIVWRNEPGLTLPATAVTRINGQYFAFVAEQGEKGQVARQRSVKLGELRGNEYVVVGGLKPGDKLIVSGTQRIADGAPIQPQG